MGDAMADRFRLIKHELSRSKCGSFEVCFSDDRESRYFYRDDLPSRRLRPDILTREQALEQARAFANAERDKEISPHHHGSPTISEARRDQSCTLADHCGVIRSGIAKKARIAHGLQPSHFRNICYPYVIPSKFLDLAREGSIELNV